MAHDIATIPGDGIGPEVVDAALPLAEAVADRRGFGMETTTCDGGTERYLERAAMMPEYVTLNGLLLPTREGFDQAVCERL